VPRNIVVCCDGTANEFAQHNTNVVKLYAALEHDPAIQATYYHPGLGTMEPAGALTPLARKTTKVLGVAFGYGLSNDIRDAYVFLMRHYQPGDKVFLFGFSRGAYTVRAVASLLHMYGLIRPGNEMLVPYAIRMLTGIERGKSRKGADARAVDEYFELAWRFKETMSWAACKPWFVGVWDTVSSVGWVENPLKVPFIADNPDIEIGRHAVAIDERRAFFRSHLWRPSAAAATHGPQDVKQVWFAGVHCDVGGGYAEPESGLAKIPLEWMLNEAVAAGLCVDEGKRGEILGREGGGRFAPPDPDGPAHESLTGPWHLAEFVFKKHYDWKRRKTGLRMNLYRRRSVPAGALVHKSVFARDGGRYKQRLPSDAIPVD
jgi:uncharacterized protein (DUF2235 family)